MTYAAKLLALAGAAAMLSGCQSSPLTSWMFRDGRPASAQPLQFGGDAAVALMGGKAYLRASRISAAIASFQIARRDPASNAEASNGLAIAYSRLGRLDLARRYFEAAVSADPANSKFAANLLRLEQNVRLARRTPEPQVAAMAQAREVRAPRAAQGEAIRGPVVRISQAEVHVRAVHEPSAAPQMEVVARHETDAAAADAVALSAGRGRDERDQPVSAQSPAAELLAQNQPLTIVFGQ